MSSLNKNSRSLIFFLIIAAIVLWIMWFGTSVLFSKKAVENNLQQISAQLTEYGKKYGKDVKLTYGEINIEGWGHRKQAIVDNVAIEVGGTLEPVKMSISTASVAISQDPVDFNRIFVKIEKNLDLLQNGTIFGSLALSEPMIYAYKQSSVSNQASFLHDIIIPKTISFLKPALGSTDGKATEVGVVFSFSAQPAVQFTYQSDKNQNTFSYSLTGFKVSEKGNNMIEINNLVGKYIQGDGDKEGFTIGKNTFKADDITFYRDTQALKSYNINLDLDFVLDESDKLMGEGNMSLSPEAQPPIAASQQNRDVSLHDFIISNPDFSLRIHGKLSNQKGDSLPFGDLNAEIDNLSNFLSSDLIAGLGIPTLESAFVKITGAPIAGQEKVIIPLKREKGGTFLIGKTTFEELVAGAFSGGILTKIPSPEGMPEIPSGLPQSMPQSIPQPMPPVEMPVAPSPAQ